jgi:hypothetical protein
LWKIRVEMRSLFTASTALACVLGYLIVTTANAEDARTSSSDDTPASSNDTVERGPLVDDPEDPQNLLPEIRKRGAERDSLFPASPLLKLHESTDRAKHALYDAVGLELGFVFTHLFQGLSEARTGEDQWGTVSTTDMIGRLELLARGTPIQGDLTVHAQGRWNYGTTNPEDLGFISLGSALGTANTFAAYEDPSVIVRNLYWQQGSEEAGWAYRIGKITPDAILSTSKHIAAATTFLPTAGVGSFADALPDSGLGVVAAWYINDRIKLLGLFSDANGDREDFGDIGEGDFYVAGELGVKIAPRTPKAGYSKLTFWHTDGTDEGQPANGNLGPDGWGFFLKHEQELTADGRAVAIVRYGKSFNDSAVYEHQVGAHLLYHNPPFIGQIRTDLVGVAFNWVQPTNSGGHNEYNVEVFYRFPLFPLVDMTLSYQSVMNPVLDPHNGHASVFSLRLRTTF